MLFKAVTFDFYNTLVYQPAGIGRGRQYQNYLSAVELSSDPWQHQVLYDVLTTIVPLTARGFRMEPSCRSGRNSRDACSNELTCAAPGQSTTRITHMRSEKSWGRIPLLCLV